MKMFYKYTGIIFAGLILSSCITTKTVPIDQMEPGKVSLPAQIRKVALISRNFKFSIDTLATYLNLDFRLKKGAKEDNMVIDSIAVTNSFDSLRKSLIQSGRFDEVFVYPYNAIRPHTGDRELPLTPGFIRSVCTESETDAVISLEMLSFFYSRHQGSPNQEMEAEANVKVTAIWSVYIPGLDGSVDRFTHSEVIRWNEYDPHNPNQKYKLPLRKEGIAMASGVAAKNYSKRIVPYWAESSRVIVGLNDSEFDKGLSYAQKNKWKEAAAIWEKYLKSTHSRIGGVAALDYAVSQEMLGDMEQAKVWSDKAVLLLKNGEKGKIAREYAATLYERKLKSDKLNLLLKVTTPG
jgi:hypothetical protein